MRFGVRVITPFWRRERFLRRRSSCSVVVVAGPDAVYGSFILLGDGFLDGAKLARCLCVRSLLCVKGGYCTGVEFLGYGISLLEKGPRISNLAGLGVQKGLSRRLTDVKRYRQTTMARMVTMVFMRREDGMMNARRGDVY